MNLQIFPRPVGDVGLGAFSAEGPVITLQDLPQLDVRVTWDEAVAIIEELCVAANGALMRPIPAAEDIILNPAGTVAIRHSAAGSPDPVEAARRLHELLGGSVAPAPLRLFISQAVSSGAYNSLSEFEDALAYFAKPGRQERVKAVYQRASEQLMLKPQSPKESHKEASRIAAAPPAPKGAEPAGHQTRRQLVLVGLGAAGVATMVVGLGLYFWPQGSPGRATTPAPEAVAESAAGAAPETPAPVAVAGAAPPAAGAAGAADRTPVARTASALDAVTIPLTGSAAAIDYRGPRRGGLRHGARAYGEAAVPDFSSFGAVPVAGLRPEAPRGQARPQPAGGGAPVADAASPSAPAVVAAAVSDPSQIVYSANDAAVQPAILSKPQLLPPPYSDRLGKPVRLELIISPAGTVERARFLEAPQRMADMMILSSAKTWQFTPAVKDGQPVRYRTVLSWVAAP